MTISVGLYPIIFLYRNIGTEYGWRYFALSISTF